MSVKLHVCGVSWFKVDAHSCWKVQKALDERGVDYELVKEPTYPRGRRTDLIEHTGQDRLPAIETADGSWIREESDALVGKISAGEFD